MGIKTYNPYTPSRRHMTGSDFSEITKKIPAVTTRVKSQLDIVAAVLRRNID